MLLAKFYVERVEKKLTLYAQARFFQISSRTLRELILRKVYFDVQLIFFLHRA